jgi:heme-degrading monooxygenase HmoA
MYARVWKLVVLPGKDEEFAEAVNSVMPVYRHQSGFHSLLVLRGGPAERPETTLVSAWESLDALRNSETTSAFQQAVVRILSCCEPHPSMREEQVLVSEFPAQESSDITANY